MTRRWRAAVAALALALAGACSDGGGPGPPTTLGSGGQGGGLTGGREPDPAAVDGIRTQLVEDQRRRYPSLTIGAAVCADGAPESTPGAAVTCTVDVEGVAVPFTVTFLGSDAETEGGGDSYEFRSAKPILEVEAIVADIRRQASEQLDVSPERLTVDCGAQKVHVVDVGGQIACSVNDGRTTRRLAVVVTDARGSIDIKEV
jgi:hypothetical protein